MTTDSGNQTLNFTDSGEITKVFRRFDADADGRISADELLHVMRAIGSDTSDEEVKQMMTKIDTDCDGFINLQEFAGFFRGSAGDDDEDDGGMKELREVFELYDLNKNGLISSTELHQILTRLGEKCTADDCVKMIRSVDADGDGYVNFEEFKKMMSNGSSVGDGAP